MIASCIAVVLLLSAFVTIVELLVILAFGERDIQR